MHPSHLFGWLLLAIPSLAKKYTKTRDAILLSSVKSLTLDSSKLTTGNRSPPVPQLTCSGGNAQDLYTVDTMRCKNTGSSYTSEDIQWTCQANLPPEFKLGSTEVVCEGFDSPEDEWVLKGSCGVEYRLVLTALGEEKYGRADWTGTMGGRNGKSLVDMLWKVVFWGVFVAVIGIILYSIFSPNPRNPRQTFGGGGGGGGGFWGGGDDDDPPPPYAPRAPPPSSKPRSSYSSSSRSAQSGPGFWSGAGLGGAAGYMAGNYMGSRNERTRQDRYGAGAGPSNWFGGGGGGGSGRSGGSGFGSSNAPSPSSSRYESTGFGGTRRR